MQRLVQAVQRQTPGTGQTQQTANLLRIYSFGPSGAGRMETASGTTIFPPAAPVDAKGDELCRAGTAAKPEPFRFGRYFSLDETSKPDPSPSPSCNISFHTEWIPDDGSAQTKSSQSSAGSYYGPGQTVGTTLGTEWIFSNDRPGRLYLAYVLTTQQHSLALGHGVHFVNDPSAPLGSTKP